MSAAAYARDPQRGDLPQLFPVIAWSDEAQLFFVSDGTPERPATTHYLGFGAIGDPMTGADEATVTKLNGLLSLAFPPGTFFHAWLWASPDITGVLRAAVAMRERRGPPTAGTEALVREAVCHNARGFDRCSQTPPSGVVTNLYRDLLVVVDVKLPIPPDLVREVAGQIEPQGSGDDDGGGASPAARFVRQVRDLRVALLNTLGDIGLAVRALRPADYLRVLGSLFNAGDSASWRQDAELYDPELPLRMQVVDPGVALDDDRRHGMRVSSGTPDGSCRRVSVLTPRRLPKFFSLAEMGKVIGDDRGLRGNPGNLAVSLLLWFPEQPAERAQLQTRANIVTKQALGPLLTWIPALAKRKESFDILQEAANDGDKVVHASLAFVLLSDSEADASAHAANLASYARELGLDLYREDRLAKPLLINHLPFGGDDSARAFLSRYRTVATRHAAQFLPLLGDWKGTGTPALLLVSRHGQVMTLDLFDTGSNFNAVVAAKSGAGKSFFMNYLITHYLSLGAWMWIIDAGKSYEKTCETLDGEYLVFTRDSRIGLNPFPRIANWEEEGDVVLGQIVAMATQNDRLTDLQEAELRRILREVWDCRGAATTIDEIAEVLKRDGDPRIQDIGKQLYAFTSRGEYGRWFADSTIDFRSRLVVLELDELKGQPLLQRVVLLQLVSEIQRAMYFAQSAGGIDGRKMLAIDEAWDLLAHPTVAKFIEHGYRRFRKYDGSATVITQSINDLYATDQGVAIAANSATKLLLAQEAETILALRRQQRLSLSEWGFRTLETVQTVRGEYSEIFCMTERGQGVGRLIADRTTQLLFTTHGGEKRAIEQHKATGKSTMEAIQAIVDWERAHGTRIA